MARDHLIRLAGVMQKIREMRLKIAKEGRVCGLLVCNMVQASSLAGLWLTIAAMVERLKLIKVMEGVDGMLYGVLLTHR